MHIEPYGADRGALRPLFALADDSAAQIDAYIALGDILVARDGEVLIGHAQIISAGGAGEFELKSLAVAERYQGRGVGRQLVAEVIAWCRGRGGRRLIVSTATADTAILRFYQRHGFRMDRIVRDAFGPETGYPDGLLIDGVPLRDQVFLDREL